MSIKDLIKSLAPKWLVVQRVKLFALIKTVRLFVEDAKYFIKQSGILDTKKKSRLARIIKNYHKIEKGLTIHPRRHHFGEAVISKLIVDIKSAISDNSASKEEIEECVNALNALEAYIDCHKERETDFIDILFDDLKLLVDKVNINQQANDEKLPDAVYLHSDVDCSFTVTDISCFDKVLSSRKSVRRFTCEPVNELDLKCALNLALKSPSACNRQPWFVTHLSRKVDVKEVLKIQKGNVSLSENVNELLVIWMDVRRALSPEERGQHFFDGGLFSMNLANSMHVRGIGSCFLNWAKTRKDDDLLRQYLDVPVFYKPVTFLAIGYPDKQSMVCRSARKSLDDSYRSI